MLDGVYHGVSAWFLHQYMALMRRMRMVGLVK
jgi:hypothetical protein